MKQFIQHSKEYIDEKGLYVHDIYYGASPEMVSHFTTKYTESYLLRKGYSRTWDKPDKPFFSSYGSLICFFVKGNITITYGLFFLHHPPKVISIYIGGKPFFYY